MSRRGMAEVSGKAMHGLNACVGQDSHAQSHPLRCSDHSGCPECPLGGGSQLGSRLLIVADWRYYEFAAFPLPGLLPAQHRLVLNTFYSVLSTYILTELAPEGIVAQQVVTEHEMYALVALLEAYPDYCPYEVLLAAVNDVTIDQARQV